MKLASAIVLLLLSIALMASFLLGASFLDHDLAFGLDAGVAAAAISLILGAAGPLVIAAPGTRNRAIALFGFFAAIAWLPYSIALAGGTQLSYSGWKTTAWLVFTGLLLLAILTGWVTSLLTAVRSRSAA